MIPNRYVLRRLVGRLSVAGLAAVSACESTGRQDAVAGFRDTARVLAEEAEAAGIVTVVGREDWFFFAPELRHASVGAFWGPRAVEISRARRAEVADPLPAILDFRQRLDGVGVELLLVPVPPRASSTPTWCRRSSWPLRRRSVWIRTTKPSIRCCARRASTCSISPIASCRIAIIQTDRSTAGTTRTGRESVACWPAGRSRPPYAGVRGTPSSPRRTTRLGGGTP